MAETIFDSYIKSIYGSGSSMKFFDTNNDQLNIFGGSSEHEIVEEMEGFKFETPKSQVIGYVKLGENSTNIVQSNVSVDDVEDNIEDDEEKEQLKELEAIEELEDQEEKELETLEELEENDDCEKEEPSLIMPINLNLHKKKRVTMLRT